MSRSVEGCGFGRSPICKGDLSLGWWDLRLPLKRLKVRGRNLEETKLGEPVRFCLSRAYGITHPRLSPLGLGPLA